jgi:FAD/FMN-containing dehydrogenase
MTFLPLSNPKIIFGWGRFPKEKCLEIIVKSQDELIMLVKDSKIPLLARGGGTSYGDASLNKNGFFIEMKSIPKKFTLDQEKGILRCTSGYSLDEILKEILPSGWFFNVTPGTSNATIGGCIACDAHGKNWNAGSFGNYVIDLTLLLPDGEILICSSKINNDLFLSTIGGMGFTGIILESTIQLKKISSLYMEFETIKFPNLKECLALQEESKNRYEYIYCWIDSLAEGSYLGRGILCRGNHIRNSSRQEVDFSIKKNKQYIVPFTPWISLINCFSVWCFNFLYYHFTQKKIHVSQIKSFFYPLDKILFWNRLYGKKGFIEYQAVVPSENSYEILYKILSIVSKSKKASFMLGIKPIGKSIGVLSFSEPGFTIAIDFAFSPKIIDLVKELDDIVINSHGRVYLSKDALLSPDNFLAMYRSQISKFTKILNKYNLQNNNISSLWKRIYRP